MSADMCSLSNTIAARNGRPQSNMAGTSPAMFQSNNMGGSDQRGLALGFGLGRRRILQAENAAGVIVEQLLLVGG
jgi:hypothetical protein